MVTIIGIKATGVNTGSAFLIGEPVLCILQPHFSPRAMSWIKNALIDLAVTAIIAVHAFSDVTWTWWVIAIYTPLMVLLKLFALSGAAHAVQQKADGVPVWFYHVLYGANLLLLLKAPFYEAAAGWAVIWILSVVAESRRPRSPKKK